MGDACLSNRGCVPLQPGIDAHPVPTAAPVIHEHQTPILRSRRHAPKQHPRPERTRRQARDPRVSEQVSRNRKPITHSTPPRVSPQLPAP